MSNTTGRALRSAALAAMLAGLSTPALAEELFYVSGAVGNAVENFKALVKPWEEATGNTVTLVPMPASTTDQFGQYRLWLAAGATDIDLYQTDVIWAPQLADHFVDLTEVAKDLAPQHFPSIIESQTVNGKLVALPIFTDAPALYYRKDLLEKHGASVPTTWEELTATAQMIQDAERAAGDADIWGFVWQGNAYEGLTCNALEWVKSFGGGQIVEPDGTISVNNDKAIAALDTVKGWVGTISPEGVLAYQEEEARGVWQTGNAVFMRNWPYAYGLGNGDDSAVKGLFDVAPLPTAAGMTPRPRRWAAGTSPCRNTRPSRRPRSALPSTLRAPRRRSSARSTNRTCPRSWRFMTIPTSPPPSRSSRAGRTCSCRPCRGPARRPRASTTRFRPSSGRPSTTRFPATAAPPKTSRSSRSSFRT